MIIVEAVEQSGGGDCPQFDPEKVELLEAVTAGPDGRFLVKKPAVHSDVWWLGLRRSEQFTRWTIYRPGFVVTTIYPEGRDIWSSGTPVESVLNARLAWGATTPGRKLGVAYSNESAQVHLDIPLRILPTHAEQLRPDPPADARTRLPADGLYKADAGTLIWQIEDYLLMTAQQNDTDADRRRSIVSIIDAEAQALKGAGLDPQIAEELDRVLRELHAHDHS